MRWISVLISSIPAFGLYYFKSQFDDESLHAAASAFSGVAATMLGFMIAALSILTAIAGQRLIKNMQKTGHYKILLNELYLTSIAYGICLAFSLISIFLKSPFTIYSMSLSAFTMTMSAIFTVAVGMKFRLVLDNIHTSS